MIFLLNLGFKVKNTLLFIFLGSLLIYFTACSVPHKIYRNDFDLSFDKCNFTLPKSNLDWSDYDDTSKCSIQNILLDGEQDKNVLNRYKLAFLEFDESSISLHNSSQLNAIKNEIKSDKQKVVIVFVHGWRHDAAPDNKDIRRFKLLLAYSRKFMNQRKDHKNSELIGIYAAWHGRSVIEPRLKYLDTLSALPSYWSRKNSSDNLGQTMIDQLRNVDNSLKENSPNNKMLVVGHSMGGNMLITGMRSDINLSINEYRNYAGQNKEFKPILGDMVVLINPASEAEKWIKIQKELRKNSADGIVIDDKNPSNEYPIEKVKFFSSYFPNNQKPVLLSLTAACDWAESETKSIVKYDIFGNKLVRCDHATKEIFSIANLFRTNKERKIAIGHFNPETFNFFAMSKLNYYGSTHELILNSSPGTKTKLENLNNSECKNAKGVLLQTRQNSTTWSKWDSGSGVKSLLKFKKDGSHNQIRRGLYLSGDDRERYTTIVPANVPFWNMRVFNGIVDHGGYVSYPTWCFLNQFLLDDVTASSTD